MNLLGIITARSHSTRIPHKNLKKIKNKCLVEITMDFVKKINYLSDAVITTDSKKIISLANKKKFKFVEKRPFGLSSKTTPSAFTVIHAVKWYENNYKKKVDAIALFQPTTPFRDLKFINKCIEVFFNNKKNVVSSQISYLNKQLKISDGSIYLINKNDLIRLRSFNELNAKKIYSRNYINSIDIDNFEDLEKAQRLASIFKII